MANKTVSQLVPRQSVDASDLLLIENNTSTNSVTVDILFKGKYNELGDINHHNRDLLDSLTWEMIANWNSMLERIEKLENRVTALENLVSELKGRIEELEKNPPVVNPGPEEPPYVCPDCGEEDCKGECQEPENPPVVEPEDKIGFATNIVYGYYAGFGTSSDPRNINIEELMEETTVMSKAPIGAMDRTSICPTNINNGQCPGGCTFYVIIPASSSLEAKKDNGIGGKVPFNTDLIEGTELRYGCNGLQMKLNGVDVKVYGEFMLTDSQLFMYVE